MAMEPNSKTQNKEKKGITMNPLTQFKKILILPLLIALALVALASPTVARADAVTDWNLIASTAIVADCAGQPPPVSVLSFAMVQGAVYDAVNAIDRGHQPYSCSLLQIRRTRRRRPRQRRRSACSWALMISRPVPGTAADIAAGVRRVHSGPARRPTGIESCWDRHR